MPMSGCHQRNTTSLITLISLLLHGKSLEMHQELPRPQYQIHHVKATPFESVLLDPERHELKKVLVLGEVGPIAPTPRTAEQSTSLTGLFQSARDQHRPTAMMTGILFLAIIILTSVPAVTMASSRTRPSPTISPRPVATSAPQNGSATLVALGCVLPGS